MLSGLANGQSAPTYSGTVFLNGLEELQTVDAAFLAVRGGDDFDFICLTDVPGGHQFSYGPKAIQNGDWNNSKGCTYTAPAAGLSAGSVVQVTDAGGAAVIAVYDPSGTLLTGDLGSTSAEGGYNANWNVTGGGSGVEHVVLASASKGTSMTMANTIDYFTVNGAALVGTSIENVTGGLITTVAQISALAGGGNFPQSAAMNYTHPAEFTTSQGIPGLLASMRNWSNWQKNLNVRLTGWTPSSEINVSEILSLTTYSPSVVAEAELLAAGVTIDAAVESSAGAEYVYNKPVTISPTGALTIANGGQKRFRGNLSCSGSVNFSGSATITFDGTTAQSVEGFSEFDEIIVDNSNGLSLGNSGSGVAIRAGGRMRVLNGSVASAGDPLVLKSDATGTGAIGAQAGSITASGLTVERYIAPAPAYGWVMIGNLVPGITAGEVLAQTGALALYSYDEATSSYNVLQGATVLASPLEGNYTGYFMNVPGNVEGYTVSFSSNSTVTIHADGDISIPLASDGDGWNLIVNPFMSPISTASLFNANNKLDAIYIYEGTNKLYLAQDAGVANDFSVIDVGQAFWVQGGAQGFNSLTIPGTSKSEVDAAFIRNLPETHEGAMKLIVSESANPDLVARTYVSFDSDSNEGVSDEDIAYMPSWSSNRIQVWSVAPEDDGTFYIQSQGDLAHTSSVHLTVKTGLGGTVAFQLDPDYDYTPDLMCARLYDSLTGSVWPLSQDSPVTVDLEAATTYTDRFELLFSSFPMTEFLSGFCHGGQVELGTLESGVPEESSLVSVTTGETFSVNESLTGLQAGSYVLSIDMGNGCTNHVDITIDSKCMGELNDNDMRDVQDLMSILSFIGTDSTPYQILDEKGADCDCDGAMTNMDILTFLSVFGTGCQ